MIEHTLQIYGVTWGGSRACHQCSLTMGAVADLIRSPSKVGSYAGDFQSVIDWRLVAEQKTYANNRRETVWKTLRGFRNGMTLRRYNRIINGMR